MTAWLQASRREIQRLRKITIQLASAADKALQRMHSTVTAAESSVPRPVSIYEAMSGAGGLPNIQVSTVFAVT